MVDVNEAAEQPGLSGRAAKDADALPEGTWIVCFVDSSKYSAEQIQQFGSSVTITMPNRTTFKGSIEVISNNPMNLDEAREYLGDSQWVVEQCVNSTYSWGIAIHVQDDISDNMFTTPQVTMTTGEVPPISFLAR